MRDALCQESKQTIGSRTSTNPSASKQVSRLNLKQTNYLQGILIEKNYNINQLHINYIYIIKWEPW